MSKRSIRDTLPAAVHEAVKDMGRLLRAARIERGLTQRELATRMGVDPRTVQRIESGAPEVALGLVLSAAWTLRVPVLRSADFAPGRPTSTVSAFLNQLEATLPQRAPRQHQEVDDDF